MAILHALGWIAALGPTQGYAVENPDRNALTSSSAPWRALDGTERIAGTAATLLAVEWLPVIWDASGTRVLPLLPGDETGFAYDQSRRGAVVGESVDVVVSYPLTYYYPHAALWWDGAAIDLETQVSSGPPVEMFTARAINEAGQVLIQGRPVGGTVLRGYLLHDGVLTDVGSLSGSAADSVDAHDLNEQGWVVGRSPYGNSQFPHAFLSRNGTLLDLHAGAGIAGRVSTAWEVNESGQVAGSADYGADFVDWEEATLWEADGTAVRIGLLGGSESWAFGLNDFGDVVGGGVDAIFNNVAWIYRDGVLNDLNGLIPPGSGWHLLVARDISNDGAIVGEGFFGGALHAFRLMPDCSGGFRVYGAGCPGSSGFEPRLWGDGCPTAGAAVEMRITNAPGGAEGMMLVGAGAGSVPIVPGCELQILPLLAPRLLLSAFGTGDGAGVWSGVAAVPPAWSGADFALQALFRDPGAPHGVTVTNPLLLSVP